MKKYNLGLGVVGPSWNWSVPGEHYTVCIDESFELLIMYIDRVLLLWLLQVGTECLEILQEDLRR